ncbi:hypothetical protein STEG23_037711 [Scotinomys teguina]
MFRIPKESVYLAGQSRLPSSCHQCCAVRLTVHNGGANMDVTQGQGSVGLRPLFMPKGDKMKIAAPQLNQTRLSPGTISTAFKVASVQNSHMNSKQRFLFSDASDTRGMELSTAMPDYRGQHRVHSYQRTPIL